MADAKKTITLATRLAGFPKATVTARPDIADPAQVKKQARLDVSLQHTSKKLGFLHAVLVKVDDDYFLFAGPSGVGKSSYVKQLQKTAEVAVLANDWVAVEKTKAGFVASDVNFPGELSKTAGRLLSGVVFLTHTDSHARDAYAPNKEELTQLLDETFDTATAKETTKLSDFWIHHYTQLPFCVAVPTRHHGEAYTAATLLHVLQRATPPTVPIEVGVIGVGDVGSLLAYQLGQLPFVSKVHIYNHTTDRSEGFALDMNHGLAHKDTSVIVAHQNPEEVFRRSFAVFVSFRDNRILPITKTPAFERWTRLEPHLALTKQYARIAAKAGFNGHVFMITNPVDPLTYAWYAYSQKTKHPLRTYQIYGVGLELDVMRAKFYANHAGLPADQLTAYGNHADTVTIHGAGDKSAWLGEQVAQASARIRAKIPRTTFGPVAAATQALNALLNASTTHITLLEDEVFVGHLLHFKHTLPRRPDTLHTALLEKLQAENKAAVEKLHKTM